MTEFGGEQNEPVARFRFKTSACPKDNYQLQFFQRAGYPDRRIELTELRRTGVITSIDRLFIETDKAATQGLYLLSDVPEGELTQPIKVHTYNDFPSTIEFEEYLTDGGIFSACRFIDDSPPESCAAVDDELRPVALIDSSPSNRFPEGALSAKVRSWECYFDGLPIVERYCSLELQRPDGGQPVAVPRLFEAFDDSSSRSGSGAVLLGRYENETAVFPTVAFSELVDDEEMTALRDETGVDVIIFEGMDVLAPLPKFQTEDSLAVDISAAYSESNRLFGDVPFPEVFYYHLGTNRINSEGVPVQARAFTSPVCTFSNGELRDHSGDVGDFLLCSAHGACQQG